MTEDWPEVPQLPQVKEGDAHMVIKGVRTEPIVTGWRAWVLKRLAGTQYCIRLGQELCFMNAKIIFSEEGGEIAYKVFTAEEAAEFNANIKKEYGQKEE